MIKEINDGIVIKIRVSPNASKNELIKSNDGLKIKITSQPVEGKANKAVVEFLSKQFKIPKSNFEIIRGKTSKDKTIFIKLSDSDKKIFILNLLNNI